VYHWVEEMHAQVHVSEKHSIVPDFDPADPQVQVFVRTEGVASDDASDDASCEGEPLVVTTEYDVFECDAFNEDAGKWLRLMPDAGFIPT
jgi:hypothetical protein